MVPSTSHLPFLALLVRAPSPNETTYVQVIIDEVYPGTRYDDTCRAEIEVWRKAR